MVNKRLQPLLIALSCTALAAGLSDRVSAEALQRAEFAALESALHVAPATRQAESPCLICSPPPARALLEERPGGARTTRRDLWDRLRLGLALHRLDHPGIETAAQRYRRYPYELQRTSRRAAPFLHYILEQVEAHGMPADIALLPILESGFKTRAESHVSAKGLWQLMPGTAGRFGVKDTWWREGRLDVEDSTRAALAYLSYLRNRFDGDWLLALAAYNAGEGRVSKAIRRNRQAGKPVDFWHLQLPAETRDYVPRALAIARIVAHPSRYGVRLASIPDQPYFARVSFADYVELETVADLASISLEQLQVLNPALRRGATDPGESHGLLLPRHSISGFEIALARAGTEARERDAKLVYTVRPGDSLWLIARNFGVSYRHLAGWNELNPESVLHPGRKLIVWRMSQAGSGVGTGA